MRLASRFTALERIALIGMMILVTTGSNVFPLTAATATNTATVTLSPAKATVAAGGAVAYYSAVTGRASQTVTWFVDGVAKGNTTVGVLTPNGNGAHVLYTAPSVGGTHTIKAVATNAAGASVSGSTTVTVVGSSGQVLNTATVTLSPANTTVAAGKAVAYYSAVTGSASQTVTWFVDGVAKGNASVGAITPNGDGAHVLYTAPATGGNHTIKAVATNAAGASVSGSTAVAVTTTSTTPQLAIQSISSSPTTIAQGQGTILSWSTAGATQLSISPSVGDVTSLTTKNVTPSATTTYTLTARDASGRTVSAGTTVTVTPVTQAPAITRQPSSLSVTVGQSASFTASASGSTPLNYQWRRNGIVLSGATSASYTTPAMSTADSGSKYSVIVSNGVGSVTSADATLTVTTTLPQWSGFGSATTGGQGKADVHVTNLNDSGPGSFRAAVGSNRRIVFDVGGTIQLASEVIFQSVANVTIDGSNAPAPGVTFMGPALDFRSSNNIVVMNIRHRGGYDAGYESGSCIIFFPDCYNVVLDHSSFSGFQDEGVDFWHGNHDVTIQNCIVGQGMKNATGNHNYLCLIGYAPSNFSLYRNLFANGGYRNPSIGYDDTNGTISPGLCADIVNNVTWKYELYGITTYWGAKTNVVGNYLYTEVYPGASNRAVNTEGGGISYASGNYSKDGSSVYGTTSVPFAVPAYAQLKALTAIEAMAYVKANAGCRVGGLDAIDQAFIADLPN